MSQESSPSPKSTTSPSLHGSSTAKNRRAYKACLHCRARKAKCDLGNIDAPAKPPCARCRREQRECVFAPSYRGGRVVRKSSNNNDSQQTQDTQAQAGSNEHGNPDEMSPLANDPVSPKVSLSSPNLDDDVAGRTHLLAGSTPSSPSEHSTSAVLSGTILPAALPPPLQANFMGPSMGAPAQPSPSCSTSATFRSQADDSPVPPSEAGHSEGQTRRRRLDSRMTSKSPIVEVDPQSLAAASLRNPTDALNLLALAADVDRGKKRRSSSKDNHFDNGHSSKRRAHAQGDANAATDGIGAVSITSDVSHATMSPSSITKSLSPTPAPSSQVDAPLPTLHTYPLVAQGILTAELLIQFTALFFSRAHNAFPMVPHHRIPRNELQLAHFASKEIYLLTAIVVVVSRQEKSFDVHEKSWAYMQTLINDLILGKSATVGAVEAILLLSENLPRRPGAASEDEEQRMAWMLVGMAVRLGYMLGLDQKTLRPPSALSIRSDRDSDFEDYESMTSEAEALDRDTLAWTYCYIFDRSISIRSGKAFWSRGPGLCFQRSYMGHTPSAADTFPSLRRIPGVQDDFAAMMQAYAEITQTMASAHDVLYPSKDRTIALVRVGDYHKYLDDFTRSINGFRLNWEEMKWDTTPVSECVWINFHYVRLYIYAFAFQAHVERSMSSARPETGGSAPDQRNGLNSSTLSDRSPGKTARIADIFPRGPMGSPDARFILEAIDAATELLSICTEKLHPTGALSYLPWRFFLFFSYAGVFLLKAVFVGAVIPKDQKTIVQLVKQVIYCLESSSPDDQHPGVRYARLLSGLVRVFSPGVDSVEGATTANPSEENTPRQTAEPELPAVASSSVQPSSRPIEERLAHSLKTHVRVDTNGLAAQDARATMNGASAAYSGDATYFTAAQVQQISAGPSSSATADHAQGYEVHQSAHGHPQPHASYHPSACLPQQQRQQNMYLPPNFNPGAAQTLSMPSNQLNNNFMHSNMGYVNTMESEYPHMVPVVDPDKSLQEDFWGSVSVPSPWHWQAWPLGTSLS